MVSKGRVSCYERVRRALDLYEGARASARSISVSRLARAIASPRPRGVSAERGREAHSTLWGDPFEICNYREYSSPFPLAARVGEWWIYGCADLIRFEGGIPRDVCEFKSYEEPSRYDEVQVSLYAYLAYRVFECDPPRALLVLGWDGKRYSSRLEVRWNPRGVEELVVRALEKLEG